MTIPVTAFTAAVCALLLLLTAIDTVRHRIRIGAAFGDSADAKLISASRSHGNLAEHAPIVLIMMAGLELARVNHMLLLGIASVFLIGRIAHIIGLYMPVSTKPPVPRQIGVVFTWLTLASLGLWTAQMLLVGNLGG